MTPEAQQLALAHVDGWREAFPKAGPPHPDTSRGGILLPYHWVNERTHARLYHLPDYLKDLNAVHEAWQSLSWDKQCAFSLKLHEVIGSNQLNHVVNATAAQRTEALLRILNLWTD